MNLSPEEKALFAEVAKILQREDDDAELLGGYEESFTASDVATALYDCAGMLQYAHPLVAESGLIPSNLTSEAIKWLFATSARLISDGKLQYSYDREFVKGETWDGSSIRIRTPQRFTVNTLPDDHS